MGSSVEADRTISLLIVEDESETLQLLSSILEMKYPLFAIYTANNGTHGIEQFKILQPDIIVTDINMPKMNGVQMVELVKEIKPGIKFIFTTGKSAKNDLDVLEISEYGTSRLLTKPIVFQELFALIDQSVEEIFGKSVSTHESDIS